MKNHHTIFIILLMLLSCSKNEAHTPDTNPNPDKGEPPILETKTKVLLIGFDGIRAGVFQLLIKIGKLPNMEKLINKGVYFPKVTTSGLTGSWGGWSDILRGVHWGQNVDPDPNITEFIAYPDLFSRLEAYDNNLNTLSFITWSIIICT
ncbi:alkaline phosphatase family protein [Arenibacter sp. 6A1]|uniref:alkaline phosphatase family protein n=1 Tax=Arenibacter sp. 6A1 TaxID=2720391 RepID=UPI00144767B2|nr:alkaline phosphatase family protein [Arenibacter sp. 6A1]NKI27456.1 alkaline phosphatase family protein [Arenibacter sp. 6A1]